ncbi:hypothetical protein WDW86_04415 [Bdellovibrionota bacterium FG-2]
MSFRYIFILSLALAAHFAAIENFAFASEPLGYDSNARVVSVFNSQEYRDQIASELKSFESVHGSRLPCSDDPLDIQAHKDRMINAKYVLKSLKTWQEKLVSETAVKDQREFLEIKKELQGVYDKYFGSARDSEFCIFRQDLAKATRNLAKDAKNQALLRGLEKVSQCLSTSSPLQNSKMKGTFSGFFEDLFDHFWKKPNLTDEDCAVLRNAYSVWSSFYDGENRSQLTAATKKIPVYNVNDHNASYYYWAKEQQKGNVPLEGLTIFHADTHTDMGEVHTHTHGHWSSHALDFKGTHEALLKPAGEMSRFLVQKVNASSVLTAPEKQSLVARIAAQPEAEIRQELEMQIRKTVHHIAQPLAASQATGVSSGDFIMCMPPWSKELPRTQYVKQADGTSKPAPLALNFVERRGELGFEMSVTDVPAGYWNIEAFMPSDVQVGNVKVLAPSRFQIVDCNNEERVETFKNSQGEQMFEVRQKSTPPAPLADYFPAQDKKNGYLLDIDLDVFVSEGRGGLVEPISWERTKGHEIEYGLHGTHEQNTESDPNVAVTTKEFGLIRDRIDSFFKRMADSKKAGMVPKVITIADSSAVARAIRTGQEGEAVDGIKAFTPTCMAFVVNYMVRKRLQETFDVEFSR